MRVIGKERMRGPCGRRAWRCVFEVKELAHDDQVSSSRGLAGVRADDKRSYDANGRGYTHCTCEQYLSLYQPFHRDARMFAFCLEDKRLVSTKAWNNMRVGQVQPYTRARRSSAPTASARPSIMSSQRST